MDDFYAARSRLIPPLPWPTLSPTLTYVTETSAFVLPATSRQIAYARSLAERNRTLLPWDVQQDRRALSAWIDAQASLAPAADNDLLPSSKQVAFAEKLARFRRRAVPDECFRYKGRMSNLIDGNK